MYCFKCGEEIVEDSIYCTYCGVRLPFIENGNSPEECEPIFPSEPPFNFDGEIPTDSIPKYIEKRSRQVQIILQPSLYERAKEKAEIYGKSFNDYIHELIEADLPE